MKKHLIVMAVFMSIYANAESNPFDLKENLQKIDKDQDVLLSALKEMSDKKEELEENLPVSEDNVKEEALITEDTETTIDTVDEKIMPEEKKKHKEVEQKNVEASNAQTEKEEEKRLKRVKEEQLRIEEERAKLEQVRVEAATQKKIAEEEAKLAEKKREEERLEVEAYEAKRIATKDQVVVATEANISKEVKYENDEAIADINITREELMEKKAADKAYIDAIAEMDQED